MGSWVFGCHVKYQTPSVPPLPFVLPSKCSLPIKDDSGVVLSYARVEDVPRLIERGFVRPVGTKNRIRALISVRHEILPFRTLFPPTGQKYSHCRENEDNPRGVWTFKTVYDRYAEAPA